jgi:outer membrane lipoprotein-sorting protein
MVFKLRKEKIIRFFLLPFFTLIFSLNFTNSLGQTAFELAKGMFAQTKEITGLSYTMAKKERIDGEIIFQVSEVKLSRSPLKVYTIQKSPKKGVEVLYNKIETGNKAFVNPGGFPWFTLKLDPMGSIMRNNQHHTIFNSGYDLVVSILEFLINKYGEEAKTMVKVLPPDNWQDIPCRVIEFNSPYFKYIEYVVKKGETVLTIADKFKLSEHMILEINEDIDDYNDVSAGQIIEIPNDYSPRMIIYIDKYRYIPLVMKIYDDKGVYEIYEYYDVVVNPQFESDEFSIDYKKYGF